MFYILTKIITIEEEDSLVKRLCLYVHTKDKCCVGANQYMISNMQVNVYRRLDKISEMWPRSGLTFLAPEFITWDDTWIFFTRLRFHVEVGVNLQNQGHADLALCLFSITFQFGTYGAQYSDLMLT